MEALKLIEVLSLLNLEDFQLNQWIFLLDSYNIVKASFSPEEVKAHDKETTPPYFTPYAVGLLDEESGFMFEENYEIMEKVEKENLDRSREELEDNTPVIPNKPNMIRLMAHVKEGERYNEPIGVNTKAENMQASSGIKCRERTQLDLKNAEQMIERDFIDSTVLKE